MQFDSIGNIIGEFVENIENDQIMWFFKETNDNSILVGLNDKLKKMDYELNLLWEYSLPGTPTSCTETSYGDYYIVGAQNQSNGAWVIIINSDGSYSNWFNSNHYVLATDGYSMDRPERGYDIFETINGNIIICGESERGTTFIAKHENNGNHIWTKIIDTGFNHANKLLPLNNGDFILATETNLIKRINLNGIILWETSLEAYSSYITSLKQIGNGDEFYITGFTDTPGTNFNGFNTVMDIGGNILNNKYYELDENEHYSSRFYSCNITTDGGLLFVGYLKQGSYSKRYLHVIKTDSNGDTFDYNF